MSLLAGPALRALSAAGNIPCVKCAAALSVAAFSCPANRAGLKE